MPNCSEIIISEEYADFIVEYGAGTENALQRYADYCPQIINDRYLCIYVSRDALPTFSVADNTYNAIPKPYGLMDTTSVSATGSVRLQNQTGFTLTGKGVIVGFIDTGIDYKNNIFNNSSGKTRIINIWDQTDNSGTPPSGFSYGTEYNMDEINSGDIPHTDEIGHGTFLAGVACGSYNEQQDFIGSAPESLIAMVKIKPAKQYLKDYFLIDNDTPVYQENDIMLAASYLHSLRVRYNMPVVIVLGLGSGNGDRQGGSPLARQLDDLSDFIGQCVVTCSGNEGNERLHYRGHVSDTEIDEVEIKLGENESGFVLELWGNAPDLFSISFVSPTGENVPRIPARKNISERIDFLLDKTVIYVDYSLVEYGIGSELIFMRFINPSPGIWTIRVYGSNILNGEFNIWGNLKQFINSNTFFLKPDPEVTLTVPSSGSNVITVGGYNNHSNAFYPPSGRGFTADNRTKPDIVAPAENVYGPLTSSSLKNSINIASFTTGSGTSIAAALTAGCCAQILEWGFVENNDFYIKGPYIKSYLIRGATRDRDITYPSPQWGYGKINVFDSFLILTRT
jgi:hypothetical protein